MRKKSSFIIAICALVTSFFASDSFSKDIKAEGVLQVYWKPNWSDEGRLLKPYLMMRFFEIKNDQSKVINLYESKNKKNIKDDFNVDSTYKIINEQFINIPAEFIKYQEGHLEQPGVLIYSNDFKMTECNNQHDYAKFKSFKANHSEVHNLSEVEKKSGCDSQPWQMMYTVKDGGKSVFLKSEPSVSSKNVYTKAIDMPLVKIKTIDNEWVYVAIYDASMRNSMSDIRGYLKAKDLDLVN